MSATRQPTINTHRISSPPVFGPSDSSNSVEVPWQNEVMRSITLGELHTDTAAVVRRVSEGEVIFIEDDGETVAQLQPIIRVRPTTPMPDREAYFRTLAPDLTDSGRILEEDRP
jgi:antitoxin (DNA-binding transcriptional repressor) of toxin-antitoxin stability system